MHPWRFKACILILKKYGANCINLVCGKIDCAPSTRHTKLAKKIEDIEDEEEEGDDIMDTVDDDTEASSHDAGENQGGKKELQRTSSDKSKTEINVR